MIDQKYKDELEIYPRPKVLNDASKYPLEKLDYRAFEILSYHIFKLNLKYNSFYDQVELMKGVGEKGRDSSLYKNGDSVGLIQCKHSNNIRKQFTLNEVGTEITKFILHYILDNSLITNPNNFKYYFVTNTTVNEKAKTIFIASKSFAGSHEIYLRNWIKNNLKEFAKLNLKNDSALLEKVKHIFSSIKIFKIEGTDLELEIKKNESQISPLFFNVKLVTDNLLIQQVSEILTSRIEPKLDNAIKFQQNKNLKKEAYVEGISKYLNSAYDTYSYMRTIIFGNNKQKLKELYVRLTIVSKKSKKKYVIPNELENLINSNNKILISSTAGMGKSTVVKRIFLETIEKNIGIPVFIELRRLTDKNSVFGELVNRFKPLYGKIDPQGLSAMIDQGEFVFIFDGFDEIEDQYKEIAIQKLQDFIQKSSKNTHIITSRPETALLSFADFQEFSIQDLNINDAIEVLRKYGKDPEYSTELIKKINSEEFEGIHEFLKNPLLVSLLYKAYEHKRRIPYKKHLFYAQVFDALYENHDLTKEGFTRDKNSKLDINLFQSVLRYVAYKSAIVRKTEYLKYELEDSINKSKSFLGISFSTSDFLRDLLKSVPLFTSEGNYYNWSHKSLQDYFAAKFIQMDSGDKQSLILEKIYRSPLCDRFDNLLDILYEMDYKTFRNTIIYWISKEYQSYQSNNYQKFNNVEELHVNSRLGITFMRKIFIDRVPTSYKNENFSTLVNFNKQLGNNQVNVSIYSHYQYYFINFLLNKQNPIVKKTEGSNYESYNLELSKDELIKLELTDNKTIWPNKDKNIFIFITNLLANEVECLINHSTCLLEYETIEHDIRLREEDDLLQFE